MEEEILELREEKSAGIVFKWLQIVFFNAGALYLGYLLFIWKHYSEQAYLLAVGVALAVFWLFGSGLIELMKSPSKEVTTVRTSFRHGSKVIIGGTIFWYIIFLIVR